jgi:hypothetical protein
MINGSEMEDYDLSALDTEERNIIRDLIAFAEQHPDARTGEYHNYYIHHVGSFYVSRGLSRRDIAKTRVWQIAQDISGRLMVASGIATDSDDYRDKLNELIRARFGSRRQFCKATGISEDMLSHVLTKRKNMSIQALSDALAKIGYTIQIAPMPEITPPGSLT